MGSNAIVEYTASDGVDIKLTPAIVARYIVTGSGEPSERDVYSFMMQCRARGLNPLAKDCYMTSYRNRDGSTSVSVIVSKDYFVRTATKQPDYDGCRAGVVVGVVAGPQKGEIVYREGCLVVPKRDRLLGGWAEVFSKNRTHPSRAEVSLEEYDQHRSLWKTKPATMIRKVALVQAIREAYPEQFGGVYDGSEMPEHPAPVEVDAELPDAPEAVDGESGGYGQGDAHPMQAVADVYPDAVISEVRDF